MSLLYTQYTYVVYSGSQKSVGPMPYALCPMSDSTSSFWDSAISKTKKILIILFRTILKTQDYLLSAVLAN